jgi:2-polyprenyl-6-methoxyphenol hydroxylase-like FAD-dependent oxidoreductase
MPHLKVLISGAGIAGNALAFWLSKLRHSVTVIERFSNLRASGLQVDLRGHGIEVLKRMGLEGAFHSKAVPERGMQIVDSSGRPGGALTSLRGNQKMMARNRTGIHE